MASVKRILGILVVLAAGCYLAFEAGIFTSLKESREIASSFCKKVTVGLPVNAALAPARENVPERMLHVEIDEMILMFRGGCNCWIALRGGTACPSAVTCTG